MWITEDDEVKQVKSSEVLVSVENLYCNVAVNYNSKFDTPVKVPSDLVALGHNCVRRSVKLRG